MKFNFYSHRHKHEELRTYILDYMEEYRLTPAEIASRADIHSMTLTLFLIYNKPISYRIFCKLYDFYVATKKLHADTHEAD